MLFLTVFVAISLVSAGYYGGCGGSGGNGGNLDLVNVLQFNRQSPYDYFYCNESTASKEVTSSYQPIGAVFKVKNTNTNNDPSWVPVYRFYNPTLSVHFYTTNSGEITNSSNRNTYHLEGVIGYIASQQISGTQPLLRFYLPQNSAHFYCIAGSSQCNEAQSNPGKFNAEGTMGYAFPPDNAGTGYSDGSYNNGGYYAW